MSNTIQSIAGHELPIAPTGYNVTVQDIDSDSTGRSAETGELIRYVIRQGVYKIDVEFRGHSSDIKFIRNLVSGIQFRVIFWDIDEWHTALMYVSDRSMSMLPTPYIDGYYDLSFSLVEY
ncbi:MAG: hypothetical protein K2G63_03410 [Oscillospiraceae bacterium]|nr:hypothetical protein [Oscillospiraceae bacterium]